MGYAPHHRLSAEPPPKGKPRVRQNFKLTSIGSRMLATLLAGIAFERQFGKDSQRGKQGAARSARRAKAAKGENKGSVGRMTFRR